MSAFHFTASSLAPCIACLFTNVFDTTKIRLQLDSQNIYKGSWDCIRTTYKNEGMRGLQKGLIPAIWKEGSKNIFRIGAYDPILQKLMNQHGNGSSQSGKNKPKPLLWQRLLAGAFSGALGAMACNPFELVKTRLQSRAIKQVGEQYSYTGMIGGFKEIVQKGGIAGLYRGTSISTVRSIIGSSTNLTSFSLLQEYCNNYVDITDRHKNMKYTAIDASSGMISAFISVFFMNPFDVVRTRAFNQYHLYGSYAECVKELINKEGAKGFYKGFWTRTCDLFRLFENRTTFLFNIHVFRIDKENRGVFRIKVNKYRKTLNF
eukprot:NODE_897_length_3326_cov_0.272699.p1 type:complete len:318 gc:universal NODE_897_length_3326_cov_0.272699:126-1079(+)